MHSGPLGESMCVWGGKGYPCSAGNEARVAQGTWVSPDLHFLPTSLSCSCFEGIRNSAFEFTGKIR